MCRKWKHSNTYNPWDIETHSPSFTSSIFPASWILEENGVAVLLMSAILPSKERFHSGLAELNRLSHFIHWISQNENFSWTLRILPIIWRLWNYIDKGVTALFKFCHAILKMGILILQKAMTHFCCMIIANFITYLNCRCAEPGYPGVYTKVPHFMPWILDKMI